MLANFQYAMLDGCRHCLMHAVDVGTFYEIRRPAKAAEQILDFLMGDSGEQRGIINFVPIQMKNRQNGAIPSRVEELVYVPGSREWPGFRLTIADDRRHDQLGIIKCGAARVREDVAEFAAFVDRSGSFGRAMTPDAAGEGKLVKELPQSIDVETLFRIGLGVRAFQI